MPKRVKLKRAKFFPVLHPLAEGIQHQVAILATEICRIRPKQEL